MRWSNVIGLRQEEPPLSFMEVDVHEMKRCHMVYPTCITMGISEKEQCPMLASFVKKRHLSLLWGPLSMRWNHILWCLIFITMGVIRRNPVIGSRQLSGGVFAPFLWGSLSMRRKVIIWCLYPQSKASVRTNNVLWFHVVRRLRSLLWGQCPWEGRLRVLFSG